MTSGHRRIHVALKLVRKVRELASNSIADALQLLRPRRADAVHIPRPDYLHIPPVPLGLTENHRWLQVTILNRTHFRLQYIDTYFSSGEYRTRPTDVAPQSAMTLFGCFSNEFLAGCGGGTRFRVHLDSDGTGTGTFRDFAIGWTSPPFGPHRAGVVFDRSPRVACESATASGAAVMSQWRWERGVDGLGGSRAFKLQVSAEPGSNAVCLVEEVLVL
ncbi:hypothetical protein C8T65DRAFT_670230 [Cerioporus squamosus]|nr:hypothetical protein C8T65DRAFT_670230 [Cerioporus squamosus]